MLRKFPHARPTIEEVGEYLSPKRRKSLRPVGSIVN